MSKEKREYRAMTLDASEEEKRVTGYASTFNEPYTLWTDKIFGATITYREQVDPKAFNDADMDDVIMQYDHEGRVFARKSNGTLDVNPDDKGLHISADLGGTELGRGLYEEIRGGYTTKMSYGFTVDEDKEERTEDGDGNVDILRTILKVAKVYDVSAVSLPANEGTSISAEIRSRIDGAIEDVRAERLAAEELNLQRRRAEVRAKALLGGNK
ncbi:MAG: HK97 family phage prohead protease [Mogibacterium sp.]|nr:HK97 family phage prohead protease [Mogibacterium sp.]